MAKISSAGGDVDGALQRVAAYRAARIICGAISENQQPCIDGAKWHQAICGAPRVSLAAARMADAPPYLHALRCARISCARA